MRGFISQHVSHGDNPLATWSQAGKPSLAKESPDAFSVPPPTVGEFRRGEKFPGPFWVVGRCCHARDDAPDWVEVTRMWATEIPLTARHLLSFAYS